MLVGTTRSNVNSGTTGEIIKRADQVCIVLYIEVPSRLRLISAITIAAAVAGTTIGPPDEHGIVAGDPFRSSG